VIAPRGPALPATATCYRKIGPFALGTVPKGLLREHRLKPGAWGIVKVIAGSIGFAWDDAAGGQHQLGAGSRMLVPPQVPHHLEPEGAVTLAIEFWA
jgi:tellurite resistance-related uncharacterized protein